MELFANMDLARMSELSVDAAMNAFVVEPWDSPADRPGDASVRKFYMLWFPKDMSHRTQLHQAFTRDSHM